MTAPSKSCVVAFNTECNSATPDQTDATHSATSTQPVSLKALAEAVLMRNQASNSCATKSGNTRNIAQEKGPLKLRALPSWCRADCSCLETIEGHGPGCVRQLTSAPWQEEWRRLDRLRACPEKQEPDPPATIAGNAVWIPIYIPEN
jgi:hypothetical protein